MTDEYKDKMSDKADVKFVKKPVVIEATQWFKNGDHPQDGPSDKEGKIVRYYRIQDLEGGEDKCMLCRKIKKSHGWVDTLEGGHIVCPEDWIITGVRGEHYPCKPDIFEKTYHTIDAVKIIEYVKAATAREEVLGELDVLLELPTWDNHIIRDRLHEILAKHRGGVDLHQAE